MTVTEFPPSERVNLFGNLSRGEVIGAGAATFTFGAGIALGRLLVAVVIVAVTVVWTFTPNRRRPLRVIVPAALRWRLRRDKVWSAPIRGVHGAPRFLRGVEVLLAAGDDDAAAVGLVAYRRAYTVMFRVDRPSMTFASDTEQSTVFAAWGEVLGSLCVERNTELTAERIGWTDVHRAADPAALVRYHEQRGVPGPASEDYQEYLAGFGSLAAEHEVLVWATVTQAGRFRLAKRAGLGGSAVEVMTAAAARVGHGVRAELADRGFRVGELLAPAEIGRLVSHTVDPYRPAEPTTRRERFGLADRLAPDQVTSQRDVVIVDRAFHRVFAVGFPTVPVALSWMWKPLSVDGPKVVTTVFEPVAPSRADRQRNARRSIGSRNNQSAAREGDGHVQVRNMKKVDALLRAEAAVSDGHQELDAYTLVVISAASRDELDARCHALRRRLREAGRATVRELSGEHDFGLAAALPLGVHVAAANT